MEQLEEGYYETDLAGRFTYVNPAGCEHLGRSAEALARTDYRTYMSADTAQAVFGIFNQVFATGKPARGIECDIIRPDGSQRTVEISVSLRQQESGAPIGFSGISRDRTEQLRMERALRDSEESYRQVLALAPDAISITRVADGTYLEVSDAFCQQTGYTRGETIGRNALELGLYADPAQRRRLIGDLFERGQVQGMEIDYRAKDGALLHALTSARMIQFKAETCVLAVSTPINELKAAQQALEESEYSNRTVIQSAPIAMGILRASDSRYVEINDAFVDYTGFAREEVIGHTPLELNIYTTAASRQKVLEDFARLGQVQNMELRLRGKHGRVKHSLLSIVQIHYKGEACLLTSAVDITERKEAEHELERYRQQLEEMVRQRTQALEVAQAELVKREKLAVLGQLTATVSHELRNPLGVIRSSNFYLRRKIQEKNDKIEKHLGRIDDQVTMCDAIVSDLLEFTRGRSASMAREALASWLGQVVDQLRESAGIDIKTDFCTEQTVLPHDREKMRRAVINLLDNAIQAVRARERADKAAGVPFIPEIVIATIRGGDHVMIRVTDNGTGMSEGTQKRAFEPLFTTRARGTGIGLANVKKIVEEHNGTVSLESSLGQGTRITITLPVGG